MRLPRALLAALLVLGVIAVGLTIALSSEDDSASSDASTGHLPQCRFQSPTVEVGIENSSATESCTSLHRIFTAFREAVRAGRANTGGGAIVVESWSCSESLFAAYPLILHCTQGNRGFDVVGLAPHPFSTQEPPPATSTRAVSFQTPTGNVGCHITRHRIRCSIFAADWTAPKGKRCTTGRGGHLIELGSKRSSVACSYDTVIPQDGESGIPVLEHAMSTSVGQFTCKNHRQAVICTSLKSHHGFLVSFQRIRLF